MKKILFTIIFFLALYLIYNVKFYNDPKDDFIINKRKNFLISLNVIPEFKGLDIYENFSNDYKLFLNSNKNIKSKIGVITSNDNNGIFYKDIKQNIVECLDKNNMNIDLFLGDTIKIYYLPNIDRNYYLSYYKLN